MSQHSATVEDTRDHGHGTYKAYIIGFVLSVILTVIPFYLVMGDVFESRGLTALLIMLIGGVQVVVHMVYFLHMNSKSEGGWSLMALLFTILILVVVISGSSWVMYNLRANMMPEHDMSGGHMMHEGSSDQPMTHDGSSDDHIMQGHAN